MTLFGLKERSQVKFDLLSYTMQCFKNLLGNGLIGYINVLFTSSSMCLQPFNCYNVSSILCHDMCCRVMDCLINWKENNHEKSCGSSDIALHSTCRIANFLPRGFILMQVKFFSYWWMAVSIQGLLHLKLFEIGLVATNWQGKCQFFTLWNIHLWELDKKILLKLINIYNNNENLFTYSMLRGTLYTKCVLLTFF